MSTLKPLRVLDTNLNFKPQNDSKSMLKNPTPRQIAFFSSFWASIFLFVVLLLSAIFIFPPSTWKWYWMGAIVIIAFGASYFVFIYYLKKYIYRKVKLIYKTIHKHKLSPEEKRDVVDVDSNIIAEVEKEVSEWAVNQQRELEKYKTWAEYRRNFVGDISHELKTPIFTIQGYLDSIIESGYKDEKILIPFLQKAAKNVERLQTIVQDLEAIARLETGELLLDMQIFDISELTKEVFEDLSFKARNKNISLEFKEGAALPYKVRADREKIRQVLTNLINNSIKYGNPNGKTKVGFYDMEQHVLIEVADNGIGIPSTHINHVFDRFYRVDKSRSREQGGSGLGLSIVKHIIEVHKQTINVRSAENLGSTFGFTLEKVNAK